MKWRHAQQAISAEEQIARYAYVLGSVPASVADKAYAAAYAALPAEYRRDILDQLRSQLPAAEDAASDDPEGFAVLMRDLQARVAVVEIPAAPALAAEFVASPPIVAYFTSGAGSVDIDQKPPWVHQLAGHETAPVDAGKVNHRRGVNSETGDWYWT